MCQAQSVMAPRDRLTCVCVCVCVCPVKLDHADSMGTTAFLFLAATQQSFDLYHASGGAPFSPLTNTHTYKKYGKKKTKTKTKTKKSKLGHFGHKSV